MWELCAGFDIFVVGFVRFGKFGSDFGSVAGNWEIWLGFRRCDWEFGNVLGILGFWMQRRLTPG